MAPPETAKKSPFEVVLERLSDYKEVISVIVFFLGGLYWVDGHFPSRDDLNNKIGVLNCKVDAYMDLTQHQIRQKNLEDDTARIDQQRQFYDESGNAQSGHPTAAMQQQRKEILDKLDNDRATDQKQLEANQAEMFQIGYKLEKQLCAQ